MHIDQQIQRDQRRFLIVGAVLYALLFAGLAQVVGFFLALVWTAPLLAAVLAYWLVQHWAGKPLHWMKKAAYAGTQGVHHAYDDLPVRVCWDDDRCLVAAHDVFAVLRIPPDVRRKTLRRLALDYPDGGLFVDADQEWWFTEAAVLDWLGSKAQRLDQRALRFKLWLERDTFAPLRKKAEIRRLGGIQAPAKARSEH